ncbi:MAG: TonB-dependent receptor, partial [Cellvibrionaceae bacterium]|nr:TonB-dependent receptor [Cellvibrionaceae bacterium]
GSGAIGGIVEMKTKDATDYLAEGEHFGGLLGLRYESNNMHSVRAGIYGKADSLPIDFLLYGKTADYGEIDLADGGTPDYETIGNDEEINTSYLNIGFDISDEQRLTFSVFDFDESLETVWQTLYHYEINEDSPVIGSLQQTDYVVNYDYTSSSNALIDLSAKVYRSKAYYSRGWDNVDPDNGKRDQLTYKNEETRQGFNLKNIARFNSGAIGHVLLTGVEFNKREEDALYLRNGVYSDFGSMPNNYDDWGFYLQDVIDFGQLELTLAGRYDRFDRSIDRPGAFDYEDSHFSPRVALAYEISPGLNLLLGYSETFRAPTPHETSSEGALNPHYYYMPNADLEAETAREFEGGFSYNSKGLWLADDEISIKASYFDGDIEDMISLQRLPELGTPPESRFYAQYQNIDNARRKGYEIELTYSLSKLVVSSSFEHLELYDEQTGENVNQAFADKLQMSATYVNNELGLQIGLGMDHWFEPDQNPATIVSRGKTYTYVDGDFTQFNLKGVWNIPLANMGIIEAAKLKFGVNNLTDKQYINARYTNNTSRVGNGSNIYIDLELDF